MLRLKVLTKEKEAVSASVWPVDRAWLAAAEKARDCSQHPRVISKNTLGRTEKCGNEAPLPDAGATYNLRCLMVLGKDQGERMVS